MQTILMLLESTIDNSARHRVGDDMVQIIFDASKFPVWY